MTRRLAESLQKKFGPIITGQETLPTLVFACACASSDLECAKFGTLYVCNLMLANDSQGCCKSAEKVWADSNKPEIFYLFGSLPARALPAT